MIYIDKTTFLCVIVRPASAVVRTFAFSPLRHRFDSRSRRNVTFCLFCGHHSGHVFFRIISSSSTPQHLTIYKIKKYFSTKQIAGNCSYHSKFVPTVVNLILLGRSAGHTPGPNIMQPQRGGNSLPWKNTNTHTGCSLGAYRLKQGNKLKCGHNHLKFTY